MTGWDLIVLVGCIPLGFFSAAIASIFYMAIVGLFFGDDASNAPPALKRTLAGGMYVFVALAAVAPLLLFLWSRLGGS